MARPSDANPTTLELEILKVLWNQSPQSVGEIRDALAGQGRDNAHTSVITILNIMVGKGYLEKRKEGRSFLYWPIVSQQNISANMLSDLVDRAFSGSNRLLMLHLLEKENTIDQDELLELRKLINKKVREQREGE